MREQRPVEAVNGAGPEHDVGAPRALIGAQGLRSADVAPLRARFDGAGDDRLDVAQAKIEPLRADRRQDMRRIADERQPFAYDLRHGLADHGEESALALDAHGAEQRVRLDVRSRAKGLRRRAPRAGARPLAPSPRRGSSGWARSLTAGRGTRVNGPPRVWNSVEKSSCGNRWARCAVNAVCG